MHTISLFQEGHEKHIDIKIWFNEFELYDSNYKILSVQDFIENGKRGWDAIYDGSEVGKKFSIFQLENKRV